MNQIVNTSVPRINNRDVTLTTLKTIQPNKHNPDMIQNVKCEKFKLIIYHIIPPQRTLTHKHIHTYPNIILIHEKSTHSSKV